MKRTLFFLTAFTLVSWTTLLSHVSPPTSDPGEAGAGARQNDARAEALVDRWIGALGGMDTYRSLKSARFTLTTEIYDAASGRLKRTRPRYVVLDRTEAGELARIERWEGDDFIAQGWDGHTAWATLNGEPLGPGDKDFDQVRYVSGDVQYWISLPFKLRDPGVNLHYRGKEGSREVISVSFGEGVGLHDGDNWRYTFEEGRTWPVEVAYREEGKENWNRLRFEDIRTVDAYVFVGRRVHFDDQGRVTKVLYTHDFELNPEVGADTFRRP